MQHVEAGLVRSEPGARMFFMPPKARYGDPPVWLSAPRTAPVFELQQFARSLLHKRLHRVLVSEPVTLLRRCRRRVHQTVALGHHAGGSALG